MKYVVKNCPALQLTYYCDTHHSKCQDCTDCVIKQVIEKCKSTSDKWLYNAHVESFANEILQLFDIEEVRE